MLAKVMLEDAPLLTDVLPGAPEALEDLIARMLAKDPDARPPDAGTVASELRTLEIGDAELRKCFVENVAESARTLALASAWLG